jgi:hypothetical protein
MTQLRSYLTPLIFSMTAIIAQPAFASGPACAQVLMSPSLNSSKNIVNKDSFDKSLTELALLKIQADRDVISGENNVGQRLSQTLFKQKFEEATVNLIGRMTKEELKAAIRKKIADLIEPEKIAREEQKKERAAREHEQEELLKVYQKKEVFNLPLDLNVQPGALLYVKAENYLVFSGYERNSGLQTFKVDLKKNGEVSKLPVPTDGVLRQAVSAYHQKLIEYFLTPTGSLLRILDAKTGLSKDIPLNHADFTPNKLLRSIWMSPSEKYILMYDNNSSRDGQTYHVLEISTGNVQRLRHIPDVAVDKMLLINDHQLISLNPHPSNPKQFETSIERFDLLTGKTETIHRNIHKSAVHFDREQSLLYIVAPEPGTSSFNVYTQKMTEEPVETYPKVKVLGPSPFKQIDVLPGLGVLRHDYNHDVELLTHGDLRSSGYSLSETEKAPGLNRFIGTTASNQHEVIFQIYKPEEFGVAPYVEVWRYGK